MKIYTYLNKYQYHRNRISTIYKIKFTERTEKEKEQLQTSLGWLNGADRMDNLENYPFLKGCKYGENSAKVERERVEPLIKKRQLQIKN